MEIIREPARSDGLRAFFLFFYFFSVIVHCLWAGYSVYGPDIKNKNYFFDPLPMLHPKI